MRTRRAVLAGLLLSASLPTHGRAQLEARGTVNASANFYFNPGLDVVSFWRGHGQHSVSPGSVILDPLSGSLPYTAQFGVDVFAGPLAYEGGVARAQGWDYATFLVNNPTDRSLSSLTVSIPYTLDFSVLAQGGLHRPHRDARRVSACPRGLVGPGIGRDG